MSVNVITTLSEYKAQSIVSEQEKRESIASNYRDAIEAIESIANNFADDFNLKMEALKKLDDALSFAMDIVNSKEQFRKIKRISAE